MNIFEDIERQKLLQHLDSQREMLKGFSDVLGEELERERRQEIRRETEIDPETGKISKYHNENCSGCSLCEN